jgi:Putative metallopeptidase
MKHVGKTASLLLAVIAMALSSRPGTAQGGPQLPPDLQNPQIEISYIAPRAPDLQPVHDRLKQRKVLEQLKAFLAPLRLDRKIEVNTAECGAKEVHYKPGGPVTLCYEYLQLIDRLAAGLPPTLQRQIGNRTFNRDDAIAGAFAHYALHEVSRAVFDIQQIPVWGREEFAADLVAGYIILHFGDSIAYKGFIGASWLLSQSGVVITGIPGGDFFTVRAAEIEALQRFANTLCIAIGGKPEVFAFLRKSLPEARARWCRDEYLQLERSFNAVIMPLINRDVLKRVQAIEWL